MSIEASFTRNVVLTSFVRVSIKDEEAARSLRPETVQLDDRENLCKALRDRRDKHGQNDFPDMPTHGECRFVQGLPKYFSTMPLKSLSRMNLAALRAPQRYEGTYLLCRTLCFPAQDISVQLAVEDDAGACILLTLDNLPDLYQADLSAIDAMFPTGTVLLIREPFIVVTADRQRATVRVDSPSDVLVLDRAHPLLEGYSWRQSMLDNPETFKSVGTSHFRKSHFVAAVSSWSQGLSINPSSVDLLLNRCMAFLRLEWYAAAYRDASKVLELVAEPGGSSSQTQSVAKGNRDKADFRAARALYGLAKYSDALARFTSLGRSGQLADKTWIKRCQARMEETTSGVYDWEAMFRSGLEGNGAPVDVADFVGPLKVCGMPNRGGGRGVRATEDIRAGALLVVSKAYALVSAAEQEQKKSMNVIHVPTQTIAGGSEVDLVQKVITRLYGCPEDTTLIYGLFSNANPDRFHLPSTTYPPLGTEPVLACHAPPNPADINVDYIDGVIFSNCFGGDTVRVASVVPPSKLGQHSAVLHTLPSLFNHSCAPNATWRLFGDTMVIRSNRDIPKNTEITLAYVSPAGNARTRSKDLFTKLLGPCNCDLCELDRLDTEDAWNVWDSFQKRNLRSCSSETELDSAIAHLQSSFARSGRTTHYTLLDSHDEAMQWYQEKATSRAPVDRVAAKAMIRHGVEALRAAGLDIFPDEPQYSPRYKANTRGQHGQKSEFALPMSKGRLPANTTTQEQCIFIITQMAAIFTMMLEKTQARRWIRAAWFIHENTIGGGKVLFEERFKKAAALKNDLTDLEYRWD